MLRSALEGQPVKRAIAFMMAVAAGGALAVGLASPASAHAALVSTDPEDGATVAEAPAEVSATFSEILDGESTEIAVTDPAGEVVAVDEPVFDGDTFTQPMRYTTPGEYTVAFRVISEDGHRVDDALRFTVESIPEGLYAPGSEPTADATGDDAVSQDPTVAATEETSRATGGMGDEEDSNTGAALAAILLGLLVVVVGGVVLVKTLGRKQKADGDNGGAGAV
jgi:methionine-rich copper-binding protein CopC